MTPATKFPAERTMLSLAAVADDLGGEAMDDGRIVVRHHEGLWLVEGAEIDELEARGWIELRPGPDGDTADLRITDAGRYWLKRWQKKAGR